MHRYAIAAVLVLLGLAPHTAAAGTIAGQVTSRLVKDTRDTVVYIDRIEGKTFTPPTEPMVIDQINKEFVPHVLPILVGSRVTFRNSDVLFHNVRTVRGRKSLFNLATPAGGPPITKTFHEPGEVALLCNIHPEMAAYIIVLETPYAAVTDEQGHYEMVGIPEGTYRLSTWHEKLKPASTTVTVQGEEPAVVNIELK